MTEPLARTRQEAHLFIDLTPCECGDRRLATAGEAITLPDGAPGRRYAGRCPGCGRDRLFVFRVPERAEDADDPAEIVYGRGDRTSELLDPGQWLWVAEQYADAVPGNPGYLTGEPRATARTWLTAAVAALREAEKFLPAGAERVPEQALRTAASRERYAREPHAFDRERLAALRSRFERRRGTLLDPPAPDEPARAPDEPAATTTSPERIRRIVAENRAVEQWAQRHDLDAATPGAGSPEQNREIERELRTMRGDDPETGLPLETPIGALAAFRQLIGDLEAEFAGRVAERDLRIGLALAAYQAWLARLRQDDDEWREQLWADEIWDVPQDVLPPAGSAWEMVRAARSAIREPFGG
ncbi:hypothetical protein BJY16_003114 [Actinoplanes octamycinicus]|uniref:Uncharacterized protein n=1 Tax=Actinoplanes octamycinicus TaxID=135948 RepID=A0A7W7GWL1_9ACTN|nr:hypothetical protein [Actinoplanes octamycinicus]MBB4739655.1 hypothetical protein [Actinoplanes octamycinicus]GIE54838.1 hypothetical protein Aoc01nite_02400 [Actinoplanes octamycinicus]